MSLSLRLNEIVLYFPKVVNETLKFQYVPNDASPLSRLL